MKKKWTIVAFSVCLVIVAGLVATIIVLASGTQGVGTSVSVLYVATDIEGTVSAKYSKINKNTSAVISTTDMVTSSGSKTVSFLSTAPTTTSLLNPTESNIALTAEQDLVITYTFTAVATYYATLEYKDNSTNASNIEFSYSLNDEAYTDEMSMPIEVTPDKSTTYSIKLHIANTARNANLSGSLNWVLAKSGPNSPIEDSNISINFVNNGGSVINNGTVSIQKSSDGTKFKIVGPTPIIDSTSTTSYLNGSFNERATTATGKVASIDDLTNSNGAEFYYFCTNSAVVGSLSYNDPETIYYTSTADSTLESWYDLPSSNINLYACFMTPNYVTEEINDRGGWEIPIIISNKVTRIVDNAFYDEYDSFNYTAIVIPQSVKSIGERSFQECEMTKILIPNSVTKIDLFAFDGCTNLTTIIISDSVTEFDVPIFKGCENLILNEYNDINYLGSVSNAYKFVYGPIDSVREKSDVSLIIFDKAEIILYGAFEEYSGLTGITIPNSVTSIGSSAFSGCSAITSITIPNSMTSIGNSVFSDCSALTSVTIPNSVASIGGYAFSRCSGLTNIMIPESVTSIGSSAFSGCSALTSVTIPNSVTSIGSSAFSGCSALTSVTIPNSVTSIGEYAFQKCTSLTNITIPDSVTRIGSGAFKYCKGLTSITIPADVTSIGNYAFMECFGLTSITVSANNSAYYSSGNCLIKKSDNSLIQGCNTSVIPNGVTSIGGEAFRFCTKLTSITMPDGVTNIGENAFLNCIGLTSIIIPNSVTSIGNGAFKQCANLKNITIPDNVTSIGKGAFQFCSGLTSVTIGVGVTSMGTEAFSYCSRLTSVTFTDTSKTWTVKNGSTVKASDVSVTDPTQNATYLTDTYYNCTWTKNS